jgi:hypothetical protein
VATHYRRPGWFTTNVFNRVIAAFTRVGISVWGSRVLEVPGRKTGEPRRTPVNLLTCEAARYLVAPRGETQWVRNLRRWKMEVGVFFDAVGPDSGDEELRREAERHPVFRIS